VTYGLARVALGKQNLIKVGNIEAKRDWGFAGEYVEGMRLMLQQDKPDDYILATGRATTVKEFVDGAAAALGFNLEWRGENTEASAIDTKTGRTVILVDPALYRPSEVDFLLGNPSKARAALGWEAKTSVEQLIQMMARADYDRVKADAIVV
jgi:GDPmannose 4,6-dehydratase